MIKNFNFIKLNCVIKVENNDKIFKMIEIILYMLCFKL